MYHIKITRDDGTVIHDSESNVILCVSETDERSFLSTSIVDDADDFEILDAILTVECAIDRLLKKFPRIKLMYALKDEFVSDITSIDLSHLYSAIESEDEE